MGLVQNRLCPDHPVSVLPLGWEALGRQVQSRALVAVAQHFFDEGMTELCLDAVANGMAPQGIKHE